MGREIVINGKFLGEPLNGVHRTAAHYASLLMERAEGTARVRLVAPKPVAPDPAFPRLVPEVVPGRFGARQGWEMLSLPRIARGALLVNFCNLAPLLHPRSVVMIHDAQTFLHPEDYTGRQAAGYRALLPWIGRRALRILTVSEFSRGSLADHGIGTRCKIDVVHNGTDHILDVAPDDAVLDRHALTRGAYVMTLGSTKGYKNIGRVLAAMESPALRGRRLVVAGGPPEAAWRSGGWSVPEGTVFTGFVSDADLRALYAGAGAFAFPSRTEGFGLPPVEAMQCGAPVVAARAGAMPEVCGDAALLVDPEDTEGWAEAIRAVLERADLRADLTARGRARAATLSWAAAGDRLWSVIEPLMGR